MSYETVRPIWSALRDRLQQKVEKLPKEDLQKTFGKSTIGDLLHHTAEVEYMFAEWYFNKPMLEEVAQPKSLKGYIELLAQSNEHFMQAMRDLPIEEWHVVKKASIGESTPLEAVGRLMNHAGMHSGQITYIQKYGQTK